jgi:catechol 2,3-dioxygenase
MSPFSIHPNTTVGPVYLTVSDLDRSELFYRDTIGFKVLQRQDDTLVLAADGAPLLALTGQPGARRRPPRTTGLYHFAILVPSRADLARSLRRLAEMRWPLGGASDHLVSEALYLDDPDGNGIEIYCDRPRETWPRLAGQVQMAVDPLDLDGLLTELDRDNRPWSGLAPGTSIGHIHLHVADLRAAEAFYHGVLGFDIMARYASNALFVSAGGYHHHIGLNIWAGVGAPPPPPDAAGLRYFAIQLPNRAELERLADRVRQAAIAVEQNDAGVMVHDPSQNRVLLTYHSEA